MARVLVHIVTHNHEQFAATALQSVVSQQVNDHIFTTWVSDNASSDKTVEALKAIDGDFELSENRVNLGFSAAHNLAASRALAEGYDYLLVLNPDIFLPIGVLQSLINKADHVRSGDRSVGLFAPLLLRATESLALKKPEEIDSCGIRFTRSLRHFDGYAGTSPNEVREETLEVRGISGAFLLASTEAIAALSFRAKYDEDILKVYPELAEGRQNRTQLFDEGFFAYREDADLGWRAYQMGWKQVVFPRVVAYHVRKVTPERRRSLPQSVNKLGVRNRFLLQVNNYHLWRDICAFFPGIIVRNLVVVAAVAVRERSSFSGIYDLFRLRRRALARRKIIAGKSVEKNSIFF